MDVKMDATSASVEEPSINVGEPSVEVEEPSVDDEEPSIKVEEPSVKVALSVKVEEPSVEVEEPSIDVEQPTVHVGEPSVDVEQSSTKRPDHFSSENFKICIHNLPRYVDPKELKKFLKRFELDVKKAYVVGNHAYVGLADEESVTKAFAVLQDYKWKKNILRVKRAAPAIDPLIAAAKKQRRKKEEGSNLDDDSKSKEERLLDAVSPLHNLPYEDQLKLKQEESEGLLKKISHEISTVTTDSNIPSCGYFGQLLPILPSPIIDGYRNKCEFSIGLDQDQKPTVGFRLTRYKAGSIEIVSPDQCPHVPDMTKKIVQLFRKFMENSKLAPYDITSKYGFWSMLTVRQFLMDTMVIVTVYQDGASQEDLDDAKKALIELFPSSITEERIRVTSLYLQRLENSSKAVVLEHLSGVPYIYGNVLGLRFRVSPAAFFQVNTPACEVLYKSIMALSAIDSETTVIDLCCGTGTIGIVLAGQARKVIGIESCVEAVDDALINARNNERRNCEFLCGKVENMMDEVRRQVIQCDKVVGILDPPRGGVPGKVISAIRQLTPLKMLIFVACNPDGASKNFLDLTRRSSNRYPGQPFNLKLVQPVDLFPHTKHCEWILVFER